MGAVALVSGSVAAAEDAVQEAVFRAWDRSRRGEAIRDLPAWVATVALNLSRSRIRRRMAERRARGRLEAAWPAPPEPGETSVDVRRALAALPRRQREAAVLRYLLDLDTREVAAAMGTSEGTVKSQLAKARRHLADALRIDHAEEENHVEPR